MNHFTYKMVGNENSAPLIEKKKQIGTTRCDKLILSCHFK